MGRLNYTFKQRYLLTASVRRDGYSAFGQGNPRATFPSVALGWVFTDEAFMKNNSWLSYGKLRASWGINGNRDIGRYNALSDLSTGKYQYITSAGAVVLVSQLFVNRLQNPNLQWERTTSYNLGLDFSLFKIYCRVLWKYIKKRPTPADPARAARCDRFLQCLDNLAR